MQTRQDRVRSFGEVMAVAGGAAVGTAAAPAAASLAGVTAIPFLTKAAAVIGTTMVSATPVGWVIGCAAAAWAAAYGIAKLVGDGGEVDGERRAETVAEEERAGEQRCAQRKARLTRPAVAALRRRLQTAVSARRLSPGQARRLDAAVRQGAISCGEALAGIRPRTAASAAGRAQRSSAIR